MSSFLKPASFLSTSRAEEYRLPVSNRLNCFSPRPLLSPAQMIRRKEFLSSANCEVDAAQSPLVAKQSLSAHERNSSTEIDNVSRREYDTRAASSDLEVEEGGGGGGSSCISDDDDDSFEVGDVFTPEYQGDQSKTCGDTSTFIVDVTGDTATAVDTSQNHHSLIGTPRVKLSFSSCMSKADRSQDHAEVSRGDSNSSGFSSRRRSNKIKEAPTSLFASFGGSIRRAVERACYPNSPGERCADNDDVSAKNQIDIVIPGSKNNECSLTGARGDVTNDFIVPDSDCSAYSSDAEDASGLQNNSYSGQGYNEHGSFVIEDSDEEQLGRGTARRRNTQELSVTREISESYEEPSYVNEDDECDVLQQSNNCVLSSSRESSDHFYNESPSTGRRENIADFLTSDDSSEDDASVEDIVVEETRSKPSTFNTGDELSLSVNISNLTVNNVKNKTPLNTTKTNRKALC